jgi:hypothetical protein
VGKAFASKRLLRELPWSVRLVQISAVVAIIQASINHELSSLKAVVEKVSL